MGGNQILYFSIERRILSQTPPRSIINSHYTFHCSSSGWNIGWFHVAQTLNITSGVRGLLSFGKKQSVMSYFKLNTLRCLHPSTTTAFLAVTSGNFLSKWASRLDVFSGYPFMHSYPASTVTFN